MSTNIIPLDYQCTAWPDNWFGISITDCCVAHDLGASNLDLLVCVSNKHPLFFVLGAIMFTGLLLFRPVYKALLRRQQNGDKVDR